ncbi:hypothetical protein D3C85_1518220 [compost metagenome]
MAGFAVIGAIRINISQLTPQRVEQGRQHLGIMDILQLYFCCQDIVGHRIYCQMQLAPDSPPPAPCFLTFHSPSPNTSRPVESITRSVMRPLLDCR